MAYTMQDLYNQYMGAAPPPIQLGQTAGGPVPPAPAFPPWAAEGMMPTMPMLGTTELPESEQVDPMLGVTSAFGAGTTAPAQYGYSPQPRPMLPQPILDDTSGQFDPFQDIWRQMQGQPEPDPLAALMQRPMEEEPLAPRVPPLPWERTQQFIPPQTRSPNERAMMARFPRAVNAVNRLDRMRAMRGF